MILCTAAVLKLENECNRHICTYVGFHPCSYENVGDRKIVFSSLLCLRNWFFCFVKWGIEFFGHPEGLNFIQSVAERSEVKRGIKFMPEGCPKKLNFPLHNT